MVLGGGGEGGKVLAQWFWLPKGHSIYTEQGCSISVVLTFHGGRRAIRIKKSVKRFLMGLGVGWEDSSRIIVEALWLEQRGTLVRNGPVKEGPGLSPGEQAEGLGRPASVGSGASKPRGREWKPETFLVTLWLVGRWLIWQVRESPGVQGCAFLTRTTGGSDVADPWTAQTEAFSVALS